MHTVLNRSFPIETAVLWVTRMAETPRSYFWLCITAYPYPMNHCIPLCQLAIFPHHLRWIPCFQGHGGIRKLETLHWFGNWELSSETRKWYSETGSCIRKLLCIRKRKPWNWETFEIQPQNANVNFPPSAELCNGDPSWRKVEVKILFHILARGGGNFDP